MNLTNGKHLKWFVASLLPHLRVVLSLQKIGTQVKYLEIMLRFHETPMQDANLRVQQIHAQLQNLCREIHIIKKDRRTRPKVREEVWCLNCKGQGHDKDHYLVFTNYVAAGGRMPLRLEAPVGPSSRLVLWCAIFQVVGKHAT